MCFSASASFGTGVILTGIGIASIKKAGSGPQRLFAAIPLLFAAQQLAEGFVWLALMHVNYTAWQSPSVYFYMIFAYGVWPVWVPLSILLLETSKNRKKILGVLLIAGAVLATYIIPAYCYILFMPPFTIIILFIHLIIRLWQPV